MCHPHPNGGSTLATYYNLPKVNVKKKKTQVNVRRRRPLLSTIKSIIYLKLDLSFYTDILHFGLMGRKKKRHNKRNYL